MAEYVNYSPGGLYTVPQQFLEEFYSEFPDYRVRWSLKKHCWQIEQSYGIEWFDFPFKVDAANDDMVRARDGYWLVMEIQPGDRMPCPSIIDKQDGTMCGCTLKVPINMTAETVRCPACQKRGKDGRHVAAYYPFGHVLMEHLRYSDPLRDGTQRVSKDVDAANSARSAALDNERSNELAAINSHYFNKLFQIQSKGWSGRASRFIHGTKDFS